MNENLLTNGWVQLVIAGGCALGLICFLLMLETGQLRFPKPRLG